MTRYSVLLLCLVLSELAFARPDHVVLVSIDGRHEVNLYPLFERHGLAERVRLERSGWSLYVEALDVERDEAALERLFEEALRLRGVERVLRPADFHDLGFPRFEEDPHVRGQYAILGNIDTFPVADEESSSTARRERSEPYHGHGHLPSHPRMYPAFVASGAGIQTGVRVGHVRNLDVAPTIAHLLGLELPTASGVVMPEILQANEVEDVATRYLRAIQEQDWDRMTDFLDDDSVYQDFMMEFFNRDAIDLKGAEAIVDFWRKSSADSGTLEIRYNVVDRFTAGLSTLFDIEMYVRTTGEYWNIDKPEVEVRARLITFVRVANGKVTHHIDFSDFAEGMRQIEAQR